MKLIWWLWHNFSNILRFDYNFFTLLQKTLYSLYSRFIPLLGMLYLGCGNSWHCSIYSFFVLSSVDTNNTNIVARSEPFIFIFYLYWNFIYVRWTGGSHSLDTLVFTVWFTQLIHVCNMAASIYLFHGLPRAVERVKKSSGVPLGLKISASWSILCTLEMPKLWFDLFVYLFVCRNS